MARTINTTDLTPLPELPAISDYERQAGESDEARTTLALEHGFTTWANFAAHIAALGDADSPASRFEAAADAVVSGDAQTLRRLLEAHPELIRARSARRHGATLLHYVGANGFENWRQKTPPNAVEILRVLLRAGAEVDAGGAMYGLGTTLGLVATSVWPKLAGVQNELLQVLLDAGASPDGVPGGWNPLDAALANGRPEAAVFLAAQGARVSFIGAAGIGRVDLIEEFFRTGAPAQHDIDIGFGHACQYGRTGAVEYLLGKGANLRHEEGTGMPPLHWAIVGEQVETVKLLLARGADPEARNVYAGDALGACEWRADNGGNPERCAAIARMLRPTVEDPHGQ